MPKYQSDSLFQTQSPEEDQPCHIIRVAFDSGVDNEFDYLVPQHLWPVAAGQRITAPFGRSNKHETAFCVSADIKQEESFLSRKTNRKLKTIASVIDSAPLINDDLLSLARWISNYYICPLGQILAAMIPAAVKKNIGVKKEKLIYLAEDYQAKYALVKKNKKQQSIIDILTSASALNPDSAVSLDEALKQAGCTNVSAKTLAQKQIIKFAQKTSVHALSVIPESFVLKTEKVVLNSDQQKALDHINSEIASGIFSVTLLHGVTDSGKTEVYIRAIDTCINRGKTAIVLLPEIALTSQMIQRFSSRFENIAVMHSALTSAQRNVQWQKIKTGQANVVIGARSAVFAPLPNLGLIVVDEEHEPSYKQDSTPRYHGRDVAIKRAQQANAHCILGSATPSLETLHNSRTKKQFKLISLPHRVMNLPMPEMKLIDMRQIPRHEKDVELISPQLKSQLEIVLAKKEQAILLLNRRGYSNFVFCSSCRHILSCRNCDVTLTFHKRPVANPGFKTISGERFHSGYAVCHHCLSQTLVPKNCPICSKPMTMIGIGSQRLEEELNAKFPAARIARVDSDSMVHSDYYRLLADFSQNKIDILAGTQVLAKGLHFPNVTLVGIISADTGLYVPDFRSNERTYQLISQVAGRTGRSEKKGVVYLQTFLPEQPAIKFAMAGDFDNFVKQELEHRRTCNLPPFYRLAIVGMRHTSFEALEAACAQIRRNIDSIIQTDNLNVTVRGPMPATISRIQRFHRMQIIIQAPDAATINSLFTAFRKSPPTRPAVTVTVDIDPVNLL